MLPTALLPFTRMSQVQIGTTRGARESVFQILRRSSSGNFGNKVKTRLVWLMTGVALSMTLRLEVVLGGFLWLARGLADSEREHEVDEPCDEICMGFSVGMGPSIVQDCCTDAVEGCGWQVVGDQRRSGVDVGSEEASCRRFWTTKFALALSDLPTCRKTDLPSCS